MKKTIVVGIYFVVAIAAIVLASCWFGQCWNFGSIASPSQQPDEQSTDTWNKQQVTTTSWTTNTSSTVIEIKQDTKSDLQDGDYDPKNFEDDDVDELLNMLEDMLGIE